MEIIYKGKLKKIKDLTKGELPKGAVKFKETETSKKLIFTTTRIKNDDLY